jgi:hypothetical protein
MIKNNQYPDRIVGESYYVEYDEDSGCWGIFGSESGHCYELYSSELEARDRVDNLIRGD